MVLITNGKPETELINDIVKAANDGIFGLKVDGVIVREKHLSDEEYYRLAKRLSNIDNIRIFLNRAEIAIELGYNSIHMSFAEFTNNEFVKRFDNVSVSVHSIEEAIKAEESGATRLLAGHIFSTDCKKGVEPRGLDYLKAMSEAVQIPVIAVGGINKFNYSSCLLNGAADVAVMNTWRLG